MSAVKVLNLGLGCTVVAQHQTPCGSPACSHFLNQRVSFVHTPTPPALHNQ